MLKEIKELIKSKKRVIEINYCGKKLNAASDWYKLRNPIGMILRGFFFEIFKKLPPCKFKNFLYRCFGVKIGKDAVIGPNVVIDPLFPELIVIGKGVTLGWGSRIFTHEITKDKFRLGKIEIGEGAVLGMFSLVRSGVKIGKNSIICSMSYINRDVMDNFEVGGIPEHNIKKLK